MSVGAGAVKADVDGLDVDFLPVIYDIIRGIEKDTTDVNKTSQEVVQKILELNKKFEKAREQTRRTCGIEFGPQEQLHRLQALRQQLTLKRHLLNKYQRLETLDLPIK